MFNRLIKFPKKSSFFLFGPRGSGKTSLLKSAFKETPNLISGPAGPRDISDFKSPSEEPFGPIGGSTSKYSLK